MVWALPPSLAATNGIDFSLFSAGYLDVSVGLVCDMCLWIQHKPIRESRDQHSFDSSPKLFAAFHALHRLLTPRHPPCALSNLTTYIQDSPVTDVSARDHCLELGVLPDPRPTDVSQPDTS